MLAPVVARLTCPHCGGGLAQRDNALLCKRGHCFDIARQGYASLLLGYTHLGTADTAEMVAAREHALASPAFCELIDSVAEAAGRILTTTGTGILVDVAAGTGRYLAGALDAAPDRQGLALDLSKYAARRAARAHARASAVVCDAWGRLPLQDRCAALVLSVFGPKNAEEFARILTRDGRLLAVTPTPAHLSELVGDLGLLTVDPHKEERLARALDPLFELVGETRVEYAATLTAEEASAVAMMGPSGAHHDSASLAARVAAMGEVPSVTISVRLGEYRPR